MMSRRALAPLPDDERAVSTVLGAVLVFGLMVVTLVTVQVNFVPVWTHDREAILMRNVQSQYAAIKSDLDRQVGNRTQGAITDPLSLSLNGGFAFFSPAGLPGEVTFAPPGAGAGLTLSSNQIHLTSQNGKLLFSNSETWITYPSSDTVGGVVSVQHLRLRVATPSTYSTGQSLTMTLTDPNGNFAGKFVLNNIDHGPSYTFEYQIFSSGSQTTPISIQQENFDKQSPPTYQYIDLMRDDLQFHDVLASAITPYTITLAKNGITADYTLTYIVQNANGDTTQVGNPGVLVPNYSKNFAGGALTYVRNNQQFPKQTYVLEHGAVILVQPDGSIMQEAPQFTARLVAGVTTITLGVPALTGSSAGVSGPASASITMAVQGALTDQVMTAPRLTMTLTTQYPAVWTGYWSGLMQVAGLTSSGGTPQYSTSTTATSATLNIYGLQATPGSTVDDLNIHLQGASINLTPRAAGSGT